MVIAGSVVRSTLPDVNVPLLDLPTFWFARMRERPDASGSSRPVFVDGTEGSHEALFLPRMERTCQMLAAGLYHELGVRRGDMVAVVLPNSIYYLVVTLASQMIGATCTPANPACPPGDLAHQLTHSGARFVVAAPDSLSKVQEAISLCPGKQRRVVYPDNALVVPSADDAAITAGSGGPRTIFAVQSDREFPRFKPTTLRELQKTVAFVCYSSGTTGLPKGVMLSHHNVVANILQGMSIQQQFVAPAKYSRKTLAVLPLFHSFGLVLLAHSLPLCGSTIVVMRSFDMGRFLHTIERLRITDTLLVPPVINALAKMPRPLPNDISSLRWIISGASPLSTATIKMLEREAPHIQVMQGYGLTETSPGISLNVPHMRNVNSSGLLLPNIEAKAVDSNNVAVPAGCVGELCFRGPNNMMGYLDNRRETRRMIDTDGFLHTGDIGYIDNKAHVYVTDRKKELIKFNGFQVAPAELEGCLMQHPLVKDCAVVGTFCEKRQTELPKAFLVLNTYGEQLSSEEYENLAISIVTWMNERVAYYKRLRGGFVIVESIPKSASGKILRRLLRDDCASTAAPTL
ncbi:hypothetical protein GGF46_004090 [Coemansia sp. RSA 552]|nr:hypothetical protein GGF46_004090 [Coemansia sp. RSA 552]